MTSPQVEFRQWNGLGSNGADIIVGGTQVGTISNGHDGCVADPLISGWKIKWANPAWDPVSDAFADYETAKQAASDLASLIAAKIETASDTLTLIEVDRYGESDGDLRGADWNRWAGSLVCQVRRAGRNPTCYVVVQGTDDPAVAVEAVLDDEYFGEGFDPEDGDEIKCWHVRSEQEMRELGMGDHEISEATACCETYTDIFEERV